MKFFKITTHHEYPNKTMQMYIEDKIIAIGFNVGDPANKTKAQIEQLFLKGCVHYIV